MKKTISPVRVLVSMFLVGCVSGFVSCSDDDEHVLPLPDEVTTDVMFGNYTGKMSSYRVNPMEDESDEGGGELPAGTDISATVDNDTIYFEDFPIEDIVFSIVGNDTLADQIVEAIGEVGYKVGYKPTLVTGQDSIALALDPEPLELSVSMPSPAEGEEVQSLHIEVKVGADAGAAYVVETGNVKFNLSITDVLLDEGEGQTSVDHFIPVSLQFDMDQHKVLPHRL